MNPVLYARVTVSRPNLASTSHSFQTTSEALRQLKKEEWKNTYEKEDCVFNIESWHKFSRGVPVSVGQFFPSPFNTSFLPDPLCGLADCVLCGKFY